MVIPVVTVVWSIIVEADEDKFYSICYPLQYPALAMFLVSSICAMTMFIRNLSKLGKSQGSRDVCITEDDIALSRQQRRLTGLATRYILLFVIAAASTFSVLGCLQLTVHVAFRETMYSMDFIINLLCMFHGSKSAVQLFGLTVLCDLMTCTHTT